MKQFLKSVHAEDFINHEEIIRAVKFAEKNNNNRALIEHVLNKAKGYKGLSYIDTSILLACRIPELNEKIYELAAQIKQQFYGKRIVLFAPLYLSNHCVNHCVYCPYHANNHDIQRIHLTQEQIRKEVISLQDMGHKRLAIEVGEAPVNSIDYILESIRTVYNTKHKNGEIRRVNVNIAATTVENYQKLQQIGIGTYILFQETYHKENYEKLHPKGPKHDYAFHTEAMDRAMRAGIDDVGLGVLFGLSDYRYEVAALIMHAQHLEETFGVGPHTISFPRIKQAQGINLKQFNLVDDETFAKIIACVRIAVPYTGMIISTRESKECREQLLKYGISQISGGSKTAIGGYSSPNAGTEQFEVSDNRTLDEVIRWLLELGYLPSFCTACYRAGRTGDRFMNICKQQQIANYCSPNALLTLKEYLEDYASPATKALGEQRIAEHLPLLENKVKYLTSFRLDNISKGYRDYRF